MGLDIATDYLSQGPSYEERVQHNQNLWKWHNKVLEANVKLAYGKQNFREALEQIHQMGYSKLYEANKKIEELRIKTAVAYDKHGREAQQKKGSIRASGQIGQTSRVRQQKVDSKAGESKAMLLAALKTNGFQTSVELIDELNTWKQRAIKQAAVQTGAFQHIMAGPKPEDELAKLSPWAKLLPSVKKHWLPTIGKEYNPLKGKTKKNTIRSTSLGSMGPEAFNLEQDFFSTPGAGIQTLTN